MKPEPDIQNPELDISHLPSGIYFLTFKNEGKTFSGKFIKR